MGRGTTDRRADQRTDPAAASGVRGAAGDAAAIERLIAPAIEAAGYDIVRVRFAGGRTRTLQVMAERKDRRAMTVEDCAAISRLVSAILDVADPVPGRYLLEVSSPGIDRPLVRLDDYVRFAGFEARIESARPIAGRRKFRGLLAGVRGAEVVMACDGAEVAVPFSDIRRASLVLTDALLAATREGQDL